MIPESLVRFGERLLQLDLAALTAAGVVVIALCLLWLSLVIPIVTGRLARELRRGMERITLAEQARRREATLEALALSAEQGPRVALSLLSKLEEVGLVEIDGDTVRILADRKTLAEGARVLSSQFETLRTQDGRRLDAVQEYAQEQECRAVYLRRYFGEEEGEACGLCDVCQDRTRGGSLFRPLAPPPRKKGRPRRGRGGRARGGGRRETGRGASESDRGGRTGKKRRRSRRRRPRHA